MVEGIFSSAEVIADDGRGTWDFLAWLEKGRLERADDAISGRMSRP